LHKATPVEYALSVMLDPRADRKRRDAMCRALLSYERGGGTLLPGKAEPPVPSNGGETPWAVILGGKKE
jgi:hypothetical protein